MSDQDLALGSQHGKAVPGARAGASPSRLGPLVAFALGLGGLCWGCVQQEPERKATPNVLLISIDMLRPERLGCYGNSRASSPAIDRLAQQGVLFEQHVSSSSWTLPAHTALFTALADSVHGVTDVRSTALAPGFVTLAEHFRAAHYATAGFYSGPYLHPAFGLGQGFEHYQNCASQAQLLDQRSREDWIFDREVMLSSHRDVTGERVYAAARTWIEDHKERPFFAFLHFWDAHFDFIPPPPYDTLFDPDYRGPVDGRDFYYDNARYGPTISRRDLEHLLALYDGEIRWTDGFVEQLLEDLERLGLAKNTIVVVTSDHGTEFFEHGWKSHRSSLFDEQIRVPLIVCAPGQLPAGKRIADQTSIIDIMPTLLELCSLPIPPAIMGKSLVGLAAGTGTHPRPVAYAELDGDWSRLRCVRTPQAKLIQDLASGSFALYDLKRDPLEQHPLADLSSPQGEELGRALRVAIEQAEQARREHPHAAVAPALAPELEQQLRDYGYLGD